MNKLPDGFDDFRDDFCGDPLQDENDREFQRLEEVIFAARNYVVPSNDLRPRILDKARDMSAAKANTFKLGFAAMLSLAAWGCFGWFIDVSGDLHSRMLSPFGDELQNIAVELSTKNRDGLDWAWVEAYSKYRGVPTVRDQGVPSDFLNSTSIFK